MGRRRLSAAEAEEGQDRETEKVETRVHCALIRGSQVHCSANHIISCLPYGFQDNVGKAEADVSCATAEKKNLCKFQEV